MSTTSNTLFILFFFFLQSCNLGSNQQSEQVTDEKYVNEQFGWEMDIPSGWHIISKLEENFYKKSGLKLTKDAFGKRSLNNTWTTFFLIRKEFSQNQFAASVTKFKPAVHTDGYEASKLRRFQGTKRVLEKTPGVKIENTRTSLNIDGVEFDVYNMRIEKDGIFKAFNILLEQKYDNDDILFISITAADRVTLEEIRMMLESSTFSRKN